MAHGRTRTYPCFGPAFYPMRRPPSRRAAIGGGWGGDPTWSVRWDEHTGYRLVDEAVNLLHEVR